MLLAAAILVQWYHWSFGYFFLSLTSYLLFLRTINCSKGITPRLIVRHLYLKLKMWIGWRLSSSESGANEIPQSDTDPQVFLWPSLVNSFVLLPFSTNEIEEVITSLNSSKTSGPSSIPLCLLTYKNLHIISITINW